MGGGLWHAAYVSVDRIATKRAAETFRPRASHQTAHGIIHLYTSFRTLSVTYAMMASYMSTEAEYEAGRTRGGLCRGGGSSDCPAAPAGRLTYRTLQLQFQLDAVSLEALKDELVYGQRLAVDEEGRVLVWTGDSALPVSPASPAFVFAPPPAAAAPPEAERRQLTVLFCDLVDSTALSSQLDPEDLREVVRAYQETCAKVIARFEGHIAQYLGDGLLVYFGYPLAHEDDAQRAVRPGSGCSTPWANSMAAWGASGGSWRCAWASTPAGRRGGGGRRDAAGTVSARGTPNLAARLQGIAAPNTLVISAATFQLLGGFFACQPLGTPGKAEAQPLAVYRVLYESMARSRLEAGQPRVDPTRGPRAGSATAAERAQVKDGFGQVVLLSGEGHRQRAWCRCCKPTWPPSRRRG